MTPSEWAQWEWETYAPQYVHPAHHGHEHDADHHQHMVGRPAGATIGSHLRAEREEEAPVVLIAEDEETIAESLAMIVEEAGYTAIVALDGRQALMLARSHRPRVILTDLMMPYLSGSDLIASVRRDAAASGEHAPHIALITAASRARAEEAGADVVISKPFDIDRIEDLLHSLLGDRSE